MQPVRSARKTADGITLAVYDWRLATGKPRGVVIVHGLGEHALRHAHVVRCLHDCGWSVRAYDQRGHGRSAGARGDVPHSAALLDDAKLVVDDYAQELGAAPLLFGHSMGGLVAAHFACARLAPLHGLMLSSPALALELSGIQQLLLRLLSAVAPEWGAPNGLPSRYLSHDSAVVDAYKKDPLVHGVISARLLQAMQASIVFVHEHAARLSLPVLLQTAGDDHIVDARGSAAFFTRLATGIGRLHNYHGLYHEIFNETEVERRHVCADMQHWLSQFSSATDDASMAVTTPPRHAFPVGQ